MHIVLWIVQLLLALLFLAAGAMKLFQPIDKLKGMLEWVESVNPPVLVRIIGLLEVLAALGLTLPPITNILPILTPLAGVGLVLTMVGAILLHLKRGDAKSYIIANIVLLLLAAFVAYGRFTLVPFA